MPSYRLSKQAAADVEAIGDYGVRTFGLAQALKYHLWLETRFELLAEFPRLGTPSYDLRPGLYHQPYESHTVFYTIQPDHILIVRVLPAGADFKRHI